jgi:nucleotidyltransferase/DNA polymerase involved in DNA repair
MATRKAKPNGQYHLKLRDVIDFMKEQSVKDIPGKNGTVMFRKIIRFCY